MKLRAVSGEGTESGEARELGWEGGRWRGVEREQEMVKVSSSNEQLHTAPHHTSTTNGRKLLTSGTTMCTFPAWYGFAFDGSYPTVCCLRAVP